VTAEEFLEESRLRVNAALDRWLPSASEEPARLHEAMRYSVFAGGKRLRPALARAASLAAGGLPDDALPACCALEMLHTYSLIHDDLPSIDDDDLRRGRPTCHVKFGEATAILAGDALQTQAFLVLARETPSAAVAVRLVRELAEAAGTAGMVGGEIADIEAEGRTPERAVVERIHDRKTAALFRASTVMGGIAGGATEPQIEALRRFGTALGTAFQIVDDVLDETSDAATLGKSPGKDRAARKMTYPAAVGLDASRAAAERWLERAREALGTVPRSETLLGLAEFAVRRAH